MKWSGSRVLINNNNAQRIEGVDHFVELLDIRNIQRFPTIWRDGHPLHTMGAYYSATLKKVWYTNQQVTSYELRVNILTSCVYCTSYELQIIFIARVTSYFLHTSYELLFIARVTSYFYCTSYELLFAYKLEVHFYMRVTSYFLTWVTIKIKMIKLFMIIR